MGNIDGLINWFKAREGRVTYSMNYRNGPNSYDCSSAVYYGLIEAGFLPQGTYPGNTESLYKLEGSLLQPISRSEVRRGDIFVAGVKGASGGAFGHTGVALSNSQIIHCNGSANGISTTPISNANTGTPVHWYRLKNTTPAPPPKPESPIVGYLEQVNCNNIAFTITGWLADKTKAVTGDAWIFLMHEKEFKELARFKAKKVNRPDVKKAYPALNTDCGFEVTANVPENLKGQKFRVMFRYGDSKGNGTKLEKVFDTVAQFPKPINAGYVDLMCPVITEMKVLGWHLSDKVYTGVYSYLIFLDSSTGKEIDRINITKDSFLSSKDVAAQHSGYLADKCRYEWAGKIPDKLKGKKVKVLHRYATESNGEKSIADLIYDKVYQIK